MAETIISNERAENLTPRSGTETKDYTAKEHRRFCMITASWFEVFIGGRVLNLNEWRLYTALALHYNREKMRAFPKGVHLENYFQADGAEERRSLKGLAALGLVERWRQRVNSRKALRFFRLPYVDDKGRHIGAIQQPLAHELLTTRPEGYDWVPKAELLTPRLTPEQLREEFDRRLIRWTPRETTLEVEEW